jgi:hypothetical protein
MSDRSLAEGVPACLPACPRVEDVVVEQGGRAARRFSEEALLVGGRAPSPVFNTTGAERLTQQGDDHQPAEVLAAGPDHHVASPDHHDSSSSSSSSSEAGEAEGKASPHDDVKQYVGMHPDGAVHRDCDGAKDAGTTYTSGQVAIESGRNHEQEIEIVEQVQQQQHEEREQDREEQEEEQQAREQEEAEEEVKMAVGGNEANAAAVTRTDDTDQHETILPAATSAATVETEDPYIDELIQTQRRTEEFARLSEQAQFQEDREVTEEALSAADNTLVAAEEWLQNSLLLLSGERSESDVQGPESSSGDYIREEHDVRQSRIALMDDDDQDQQVVASRIGANELLRQIDDDHEWGGYDDSSSEEEQDGLQLRPTSPVSTISELSEEVIVLCICCGVSRVCPSD